jgi:large subunit ribosomal protein L17
MRHKNHRHQLGVTSEHRSAMLGTLASSLFIHGRIKTTLAKAKALRPFAERIITLAKRAKLASIPADGIHCRRLAAARLRNEDAVKILFNDRAGEFLNRNGGYTRIYKLGRRVGDAAEVAIIELIAATDTGYSKTKAETASVEVEASAEAKD